MSGIGRASVLIGAGTIVSRLTGFLRADRAGLGGRSDDRAPATPSRSRTSCPTTSTPSSRRACSPPSSCRRSSRPPPTTTAGARSSRSCSPSAPWCCSVTTVVADDRRALARRSSTPRASRPTSRRSRPRSRTGACRRSSSTASTRSSARSLNARRVFGPFTWAPIVNNVVSIAGFLRVHRAVRRRPAPSTDWTPEMIALLGRHRDLRHRRAGRASCCCSGAGPACMCAPTSAGAASASARSAASPAGHS